MKAPATPTRQQRALLTIRVVRGWIEKDRAELGPEYDVSRALAQLVAQCLPNARVALYLAPVQGEAKPTLWVSDECDLEDLRAQVDVVEENRRLRLVGGES